MAGAFAGFCVKNDHVGNMHRRRLIDDLAFFAGLGRALMLFSQIHPLYDHAVFLWQCDQNLAGFVAVFACDYFYGVILFYFHGRARYTTSGARDMIF